MLEHLKNKNVYIPIILVFCLVLFVVYLLNRNTEFTDNAYLKSDIIIIKPKITGYIKEVLVKDNQEVKTGDIIAKIDNNDYKAKLKLAEAVLNGAIAKVEALKTKVKIQEIEMSNAILKENSSSNSLDLANKELKRAEFLIKDKTISQADVDKKREVQKNLNNEYIAAKANAVVSTSQRDVINLELKQAEAELEKDRASFELAQIDLEHTIIKAPVDGIINVRSLQVGQLATPNLALSYLVKNDVWVLANFKETQITKMKMGQEVIVKIDSFKQVKFKAKVSSLSPATGSEFSILPPENATGNFTKIVQRVPVKIVFEPNQDLSNLKSGLSCEVKVYTR